MKPYIILNKRTLLLLIIVIAVTLLVFSRVVYLAAKRIDGSTNSKREAFLLSVGVTDLNGICKKKEIVIPKEFPAVYKEYNRLQKEAGFDLKRYEGKEATLYTYFTESGNEINLIVHKGQIIGGDIVSSYEVLPLK